jgi:hypothetical protein
MEKNVIRECGARGEVASRLGRSLVLASLALSALLLSAYYLLTSGGAASGSGPGPDSGLLLSEATAGEHLRDLPEGEIASLESGPDLRAALSVEPVMAAPQVDGYDFSLGDPKNIGKWRPQIPLRVTEYERSDYFNPRDLRFTRSEDAHIEGLIRELRGLVIGDVLGMKNRLTDLTMGKVNGGDYTLLADSAGQQSGSATPLPKDRISSSGIFTLDNGERVNCQIEIGPGDDQQLDAIQEKGRHAVLEYEEQIRLYIASLPAR